MGKAAVDIPAPFDGVITKIHVQDGEEIDEEAERFEITQVETQQQAYLLALRILAKRFGDDHLEFERFLQDLGRESIVKSIKVFVTQSPEDIILHLGSL